MFKQTKRTGIPDALGWSVRYTAEQTSESEWVVKDKLRRGIYQSVKSGRRTIILPDSVRRHFQSLPSARYVPPRIRNDKHT